MSADSTESTQTQGSPSQPPNEQDTADTSSLIEQARSFLQSPTVHPESENAKRTFLLNKGLREQEISTLLQERSLPPIPPRTYPLPPPSNLPLYIALLLRLTVWTVGITGILSFIYKRLLLGRIIRSLAARHQLILHQTDLMSRLENHIKTLKDEQRTSYKPLLRSVTVSDIEHIKSLQDILFDSEGTPSLSVDKIIWVMFNGNPNDSFTVDGIVGQLEKAFPEWLQAQGWKQIKQLVLHELETSDSYSKSEEQDKEAHWSLSNEPQSNPPSDPTKSLNKLRDAIAKGNRSENMFQYVFKSLTDFTAFLSRETFQFYTVDTAAFRRNYFGETNLSPIQDEVRREIRALKGLVLNRRSFVPTPIRSPSFAAQSTQP